MIGSRSLGHIGPAQYQRFDRGRGLSANPQRGQCGATIGPGLALPTRRLGIALFGDRNRYPGRPLERLLAVDEYFSLVAVLQADGNIHCRDHVTVWADDLLAVADDRQTGGLQAVRPVFYRGEADVRPKFNRG